MTVQEAAAEREILRTTIVQYVKSCLRTAESVKGTDIVDFVIEEHGLTTRNQALSAFWEAVDLRQLHYSSGATVTLGSNI